jgi:pyruvate dehydrogenase E2 component (dihydrolipoamide acetyltransferase)
MALVDIQVPDIGDVDEVGVIELLVKPGDTVKAEQSLITVESDKASMEIPSSHAGVVKELRVQVGDKVKQGSVVLTLEVAGASESASNPAPAPAVQAQAAIKTEEVVAAPAAAPAAAPPPAAVPAAAPLVAAAVPAHQPGTPSAGLPHASPSVRKFARALGVPLDELVGTGPKGRITQDDVQNFTKSVMGGAAQTRAAAAKAPAAGGSGEGLNLLPWPKVDFAKFGPIERKDISRIKKISAVPTCTATGWSSRTSPTMTMPTSPSSKPSACN